MKNINITLERGRIMGLIGQNGAGKTTLIKLILNMIDREQGAIQIMGRDNIREEAQVKSRLGVVFDHSIFYRDWTVAAAGRIMQSFFNNWSMPVYQQLLKRFKLPADVKVSKLSRGMQMKLMLATALAHEAKLLILDEPTSGLDPTVRDEILWLLQGFVENGENSVLFSTHITSDLEKIANDIVYLRKGMMHYSGALTAFLDQYYAIAITQEEIMKNGLGGKIIGPRDEAGLVRGIIEKRRASAFSGERLSPASLEDIMVCLERKGAAHG